MHPETFSLSLSRPPSLSTSPFLSLPRPFSTSPSLSTSPSIYLALSLSPSPYLSLYHALSLPRPFSLSTSPFLYLTLSLYLALSLSTTPSLYLALSLPHPLYLPRPLSLPHLLSLSLPRPLSTSPFLSLYLALSLSTSPSLSFSLPLSRPPSPGVLSPQGEREDQVQADGARGLPGEEGGAGGVRLHGAGGLQRARPGVPHQPGRHAPLQHPRPPATGGPQGVGCMSVCVRVCRCNCATLLAYWTTFD